MTTLAEIASRACDHRPIAGASTLREVIAAAGLNPDDIALEILRAAEVEPLTGNWISADDVDRLTRIVDVALNGEDGAARAPKLCDIASQCANEARLRGGPILQTNIWASAKHEVGG